MPAVLVLVMAAVVPLSTLADLVRPFRVPFSPVLPALSALACPHPMADLSIETWLRFLARPALGPLLYAAFGHRNSRVGRAGTAVSEPAAPPAG